METFLLWVLIMSPMIVWWLYVRYKAGKCFIKATDAQIKAYDEEMELRRNDSRFSYLSENKWSLFRDD